MARYKTTPMIGKYVGEHLPNNTVWPGGQVQYLSEKEREAFEIGIYQGKLYTKDGTPFDTSGAITLHSGEGRAIFVMDQDGTFYGSNDHEVGRFHHSSLVAGQPLAAAGEIVVRQGTLLLLSNRSGHYRPNRKLAEQALHALKTAGVDIRSVEVDLTI